MTPARLQTIEEIFHAALDQEPDQIGRFVDAACEGDELLRRKVEALLASHQRAGSFIEIPAAGIATRIIENGQADLLVGQTIGHYKISKRIGTGGMGEVYLATDITAGRKAALKLLPMRFTGDAERLKRFQQEARAVVGLNHPNILTVYEIGEDHSTHYIASELIEGETLRERLLRGRMQLSEAVDVAIQVARALAAAHEAGIVHRDIKPENIMLRPDGYVKVLDFGIAKLAEQEMPVTMAEEEAVLLVETNLGSILGTVRYMSPEQARGAPVDKCTDIWSLGVVLYEMAAGQAPFTGDTPGEVMASILGTEPPLLSSIAQTPAELQQIVSKALSKERERRYQSAHEMLEALKSFRRGMEFKAELERSTAAPSWLRWARSPTALVLVLLVAALALALPFYWQRNLTTNSIPEKSIAILPFKPLVPETRDPVLEMGMADSLITKLSGSGDMIVPSLASVRSFGGLDQDAIAAGRKLGVSSILEGNVQKAGDQLRVTVRLLKVADGISLWSGTFDEKFTDVFTVQDTISRKIAEALALRLNAEQQRRLTKRYTENVAAYQLYLTGRFHWNKFTPDDLAKSIDFFEQAVALDPGYALAYFGLGDAYRALGMTGARPPAELFPKAKTALAKALEIDESLAEAHATVATVHILFDWDWPAAEQEARQAIALDPNSGAAHLALAQALCTVGRHPEGLREAARGRELDRVSLLNNSREGALLYFARHHDEAIERLQRTLELDRNFWIARMYLGKAYLEKGKRAEALSALSEAVESSHGNPEVIAMVGYFRGRTGDHAQARATLEQLQSLATKRYVAPYHIAVVHAGMGEQDEAIAWLEKGFADRDPRMSWLKVEPSWDALRANPRFIDLLRRLRLE